VATTDGPPRLVHGPYHRLWAEDVQDAETIVKQVLSGELWGKPARFSNEPAAKAYRGALPVDEEGFEFWAFERPDNDAGRHAYWRKPGVFLVLDASLEVVKLEIAFVRVTQALHAFAG